MYIMKSTECIIFSMNNSTNINKTSNHLSPQVIEYNLSPQAIEYHLSPQVIEYNLSPQAIEYNLSPQVIEYNLSPQAIEYNLSPQAIECKQTTTYDVENPDPGFGGVQNMAGVNRLMRSYPSPLIMALPTTIQI